MNLFAMDCDGTVDISSGPVPLQLVIELAETNVVFVIGNKMLADRTGLPWDQLPTKSDALGRWKLAHPECRRFIVVDDTPAQYPNGWDGWEFKSPAEFLKEFG